MAEPADPWGILALIVILAIVGKLCWWLFIKRF